MITVSVCIIAKDEEETISRILDASAKFADEIIFVDTGSTDKTREIAARYTDKIYDFLWVDDFSAARNYSFSKASCDYLMWLDADDTIDKDNINALIELKKNFDTSVDIVYMKYNVSFDTNGAPTFSYYRERLVRRCPFAIWVEPVHEVLMPFGKSVRSPIAINHQKLKSNPSGRNLKILEKHLLTNGLSPRLQFYYARELMHNGRIQDAIGAFEKYLDDGKGWIENNIDACVDLAYCHRNLGNKSAALGALLRSLTYDNPRPEAAFNIGSHFFDEANYSAAAFWYETALNYVHSPDNLGFFNKDYNGFLPAIQLAVTYDRLGHPRKAADFNTIAGQFNPRHPSYLSNSKYFESKLNNKDT